MPHKCVPRRAAESVLTAELARGAEEAVLVAFRKDNLNGLVGIAVHAPVGE
jgi:hypothetical protein